MEGDPDGAREVLVPRLREHRPGTGTISIAVPRGWAGPGLLAMILFEKYGQHQPLNRQAERYARKVCP